MSIFKDPFKMGFVAERFAARMLGATLLGETLDHQGVDMQKEDNYYQVKWLGKKFSLKEGTIDSLWKGLKVATKAKKEFFLVFVGGDINSLFIKKTVKVTPEFLEMVK